MRISNLTIENYRSIKMLSLKCNALITLIGPNNHGKSNILSALDFALSTSAKPTEHDFFIHREPGANDLWVEMEFSDLTEQKGTTLKRYVLGDDTVCIRKTARIEGGTIEISYNGWAEQPQEEWLRSENAGNYTARENVNETPLKELVPPSGRLTRVLIEDAQQKYVTEHRSELNFSRSL